jgi:hypothetical protein
MVLRYGQTRIEIDGTLQMLYGLGVTLEHGEKEADFVLNARGFRIECRGFLPFGKGAGGITVRSQFGRASFQLAEILGVDGEDCQEQS